MCTAIFLNKKHVIFGRNMDISYSFGEQVVIMPRCYPIHFKARATINKHYGMIGMACVVNGTPLYSDGMNEHGLCVAALNFQGYAHYIEETHANRISLAPYEVIPFLLATCKNIDEVRKVVQSLELINIPFGDKFQLPYLHWMISDQKECVVLESVKDGIRLYENPVGVMTNNPEFSFHTTNLNQYLNVSPKSRRSDFGERLDLRPLGHGDGGMSLPGDTGSVSRFVRGVFVKENATTEDDVEREIAQFFRISSQVAVVKGNVILEDHRSNYTTYTSCMVPELNGYFYTTYYNQQITGITMSKEEIEGNNLVQISLEQNPQINWKNLLTNKER